MFGEERNLQMPHRSFSQSSSFLFSHYLLNLANEAAPGAGSPGLQLPSSSPWKLPRDCTWLRLWSHLWADALQISSPAQPTCCPELACWHNCYLQITKWTYSRQIPTQTAATPGSPSRMETIVHQVDLSGVAFDFSPSSCSIQVHSQANLKFPQPFI